MILRRRAQRGQAAVELCFVLPVCLLLFMGVYTAGSFISDLNVAGQATRAGSRLGAEIGNYGFGSSSPLTAPCMTGVPNSPCQVDQDIVTAVATVAKGLQNVTSIDEIDIYDPCTVAGSCSPTSSVCNDLGRIKGDYTPGNGDKVDAYHLVGSTWTLQGTAGYTLNLRTQAHPNELAVGVRILYTFQASAPISFFNKQASQYAVMCLAPTEAGT
jgi:Flp pilus assembly protein TadG